VCVWTNILFVGERIYFWYGDRGRARPSFLLLAPPRPASTSVSCLRAISILCPCTASGFIPVLSFGFVPAPPHHPRLSSVVHLWPRRHPPPPRCTTALSPIVEPAPFPLISSMVASDKFTNPQTLTLTLRRAPPQLAVIHRPARQQHPHRRRASATQPRLHNHLLLRRPLPQIRVFDKL
jgi:hypothetical protein